MNTTKEKLNKAYNSSKQHFNEHFKDVESKDLIYFDSIVNNYVLNMKFCQKLILSLLSSSAKNTQKC